MTPSGRERPAGRIAEWLKRDFGSLERFKRVFKTEAVGHFGSGWAWLVLQGGRLQVTSYHDADSPIVHEGVVPILTADVWEHAYYLDYQNARASFLDAFLNHLANWRWAGERLESASA